MILSVIIPAHGRSDLLIRCLQSLDQSKDLEYEVCVIDDGSGLSENEIRSKSNVSYPLIWRSFPAPKGRSAARNEGIRSTSGEIIVFLDSDMESRKGFLEAHLNIHRKYTRSAAVGRILWPEGGSFLRYIGTRGATKLNSGDTVPPWYFVTGNASIERNNLPSQEPFDETIPGWGGEDLDLGIRLRSSGVTFNFTPEAISYHNFDGDLKSHINRTFLYGRNSLPILTDRYPEILRITKLYLLDSFSGRIFVNNILSYMVFVFASVFDKFPLPSFVFDYLTFAAYARGWLEGKKI